MKPTTDQTAQPRVPLALRPVLGTLRAVAYLLSISDREASRRASAGQLPGRVTLGDRCVRWHLPTIRRWCKAGCPDVRTWTAEQAARSEAGVQATGARLNGQHKTRTGR